jgi:threonine dehydratase
VPSPVRPTADAIREAAAALRAVAPPTPLVECAPLSRRLGAPVWLKCEQFQPVGAFKIRGAFTAIRRLPPEARGRGIVTHSSGNHGQAVAFVAQRLGLRAVVVMPRTAPAVKVEGVRRHGAQVEVVEPVSTARGARAAELAEQEGLTLVPPYDDPDIVLGQATCAWEILEQAPKVETIVSPIGGGGLLAGTCVAVQAVRPGVRVVGVEPRAVPKLSRALAAGRPVAVEAATSVADGLLPLSVGRLTFEYLRPVVREAASVSEEEIIQAMQLLYWDAGLRVEPSGAAAAAALLAGHLRPTGPTAVILSGGNVEPELFARLVAR